MSERTGLPESSPQGQAPEPAPIPQKNYKYFTGICDAIWIRIKNLNFSKGIATEVVRKLAQHKLSPDCLRWLTEDERKQIIEISQVKNVSAIQTAFTIAITSETDEKTKRVLKETLGRFMPVEAQLPLSLNYPHTASSKTGFDVPTGVPVPREGIVEHEASIEPSKGKKEKAKFFKLIDDLEGTLSQGYRVTVKKQLDKLKETFEIFATEQKPNDLTYKAYERLKNNLDKAVESYNEEPRNELNKIFIQAVIREIKFFTENKRELPVEEINPAVHALILFKLREVAKEFSYYFQVEGLGLGRGEEEIPTGKGPLEKLAEFDENVPGEYLFSLKDLENISPEEIREKINKVFTPIFKEFPKGSSEYNRFKSFDKELLFDLPELPPPPLEV
jgi:hypothetical protein